MGQDVKQIMVTEKERTNPDYTVYVPGHFDGSTDDGLNEHFLVFDGPEDSSLMAIWTQSAMASGLPGGRQTNRIVFSRSEDNGKNWSHPEIVVDPARKEGKGMASWAFPMVSDSGRIYVIYNRNVGNQGWIEMHTGIMEGVYSDDNGQNWSSPQKIEMPTSCFDDPAGEIPPEWIVWQKPIKDLSGNYFAGYSHWLHPEVATLDRNEIKGWTWIDSVCEFMRFVNINDDPEPEDIEIEFSAREDQALRVPHHLHPEITVTQEPSLVRLPDESLFCVMRTCTGYIWWTRSLDDGQSWCAPRPLLYKDFANTLQNPVTCDPIYQLADGRYAIFYCNHTGEMEGGSASEAKPRRPIYISLAEFRPEGDQPLWFSKPKLFMDTDGYTVNGLHQSEDNNPLTNSGLALYSSFTTKNGENVLWYPDRKFFLLGKKITEEFLADMTVPG